MQELPLRGLSRDEVDSLAKQLSAGSAVRATPRDDFADLLFERTGGNPFLVRQLGRLLLEAGDPYAVPPGIRHVMSSRLAALTPPALRLLEGASVLGREFDLAVAASVSGMDQHAALDAYDEAARHGLVEAAPGTGHRFVHALFQEAVLAALPPGRSVRLHAAAGQQLELIGAPADLVAEHLWLARDLTGPAAVPHLVAAAESAAAMLAYEQAEHHLRRAAELLARSSPPDQQRELTVLLTLFTLVAATRGWGAADASALAQRARRLASTVGLRADALRLWWSLWLYFLGKGDFTTTGELALTLAEQVPDDGVSAAAAAAHLMSFFRHLARPGTEAQALRELEVAAGVVEKASATDLASYDLNVAAMVHLARAYVAAFGGDVEGQRAAARHAVTVADADGRPSARAMARTLAAQTAALAGAPVEEVRLLVDDARQVDDHYGYAYLSEQVSIFEVWVRAHAEGVTPEDVAALDSVVHRVVEKGVGGTEAIGLCLLGDVRTLAGDARGARQAYLEARAVPGANGQLMVAYLDRRLQA